MSTMAELKSRYNSTAEFIAALENEVLKLAEEQPDFRYTTNERYLGQCFYHTGSVHGPECNGCIFGQALQRMGWTPTEETDFISSFIGLSETDPVLDEVQRKQDYGQPWSLAVQPILDRRCDI